MKLVTIVCEAHARGPVTDLLRKVGAHGWTLFPVEGEGARGDRPADIPEFTNLQIQAIVPPAVATMLLESQALTARTLELTRDIHTRTTGGSDTKH